MNNETWGLVNTTVMYNKILALITIHIYTLILVGIAIFAGIYAFNKNVKFTVPAGIVIPVEIISIYKNTLTANINDQGDVKNFTEFLIDKDCKVIIDITPEGSSYTNRQYAKNVNIFCDGKNYPLIGKIIEPDANAYGIKKPIHIGKKFYINTAKASDW